MNQSSGSEIDEDDARQNEGRPDSAKEDRFIVSFFTKDLVVPQSGTLMWLNDRTTLVSRKITNLLDSKTSEEYKVSNQVCKAQKQEILPKPTPQMALTLLQIFRPRISE